MGRTGLWLAIGCTTGLALGGCNRSTPVASVAEPPACGTDAAVAQLRRVLLAPPEHVGRSYARRVGAAQLELTQAQMASFDADTRVSACSATVHLSSPMFDPATTASTQRITYTLAEQADGAVRVGDVQAADGGDLQQFALLLEKGRSPTARPSPTGPATPSITPVAAELPDATPSRPHAPAPLLSDDTQSLVDQAGDSRAAPDNQTGAPAAASPAPTP